MAEKKTQPIVIDNVPYDFNDLTPEQQTLFNHCVDLDRKIASTAFNLDQLNIGKNAAFALLKQAMEARPEATQEPQPQG